MTTNEEPGVVDNRFRVDGVQSLRVAGVSLVTFIPPVAKRTHVIIDLPDISVIPFPVVAHTQSVAYVLGEMVRFRRNSYKS